MLCRNCMKNDAYMDTGLCRSCTPMSRNVTGDNPVCRRCGHTYAEHDRADKYTVEACAVDGCECKRFELPTLSQARQGIPDPDRPGRVLHPFNLSENPTFLPGDKVRDRRDGNGKVWRIVGRVARLDDEMMTLREVGDDTNERTLLASGIVPHLEMVAMFSSPEDVPTLPPTLLAEGEA